ncbi:MAG: hypothetical protein HC803_11075 [Saprospiraceae bacterium]|nr:hypothetical protein [Saprospiraceae bacterium]
MWDIRFTVGILNNDPIIEDEYDAPFIFSDKWIDGQLYEMNISMDNSVIFDGVHNDLNLDFIIPDYEHYLLFRTISKTYYDFLQSWREHYDNQNTVAFYNNTPDIGMASFSEVQPLYTNIKTVTAFS